MFLADIYGDQQILMDGIVPRDLALTPRSNIPANKFNTQTGWADKDNPAWDSLPEDRRRRVFLSPQLTATRGFGSLTLHNEGGNITVPETVTLNGKPGGAFRFHEEFAVVEACTAGEGVRMAREIKPDLVLLDVDLPDMDGREACRLMRKNGVMAPVIMLTAAASDSDTILGLESGANDYVTKPFRFGVLLARIRAQLRSHEASEDAVFSVGPYSFRPGSKMLQCAPEPRRCGGFKWRERQDGHGQPQMGRDLGVGQPFGRTTAHEQSNPAEIQDWKLLHALTADLQQAFQTVRGTAIELIA